MHRATATAKLSGGEFALCADNPAFFRMEDTHPARFDVLIAAYFTGSMKLREEVRFAACLVVRGADAPKFDNEACDKQADAIAAALGPVSDLKELRRAIDETLNACLPPKTAKEGEGGGDAPSIPTQTPS